MVAVTREVNQRLFVARRTAIRMWPYAAHALLSLVDVPTDQVPIMGVDKFWRLYYNPEAIETISIKQLAGILLHEISHLLYRHHKRAVRLISEKPSRAQHFLWNVATDMAINDGLRGENIELPENVYYPETCGFVKGLPAEEYFDLLCQQRQQAEELMKAAGQSGEDGEGQSGESWDGSEGSREPQDSDPRMVGSGSCSDGAGRPWEQGEPTDENPGLDTVDQEIIIKKTAEHIDSRPGTGHGRMKKWADGILRPKLDPKAAFMRLVRAGCEQISGQGEYTYRRPSRRSQGDIILPSSYAPVPRITGIIDTSGSMGSKQSSLCLGLIASTLNAFRLRDGIHLIVGDTCAAFAGKIFDASQIELVGGGGTDMAALIIEAANGKPRPELIIVATDAETGWPHAPVGIPVVACVAPAYSGSDYWLKQIPPWIKYVILEPSND